MAPLGFSSPSRLRLNLLVGKIDEPLLFVVRAELLDFLTTWGQQGEQADEANDRGYDQSRCFIAFGPHL